MQVPANGAALQVEGLWKSFGALEVLRGIDLRLAEHEIVAVIGASGSGKSTLLRCINLLEPIDAGRIVVEGEEITAPGVNVDRIRRRIGIVFQAFNLFPHMTVLQNVTLSPRKVLGRSPAEADAAATALLERFGLADKAHDYPDRLSGRWPCSQTCCSSTRSRPPSIPSWSPRCSTSSASWQPPA